MQEIRIADEADIEPAVQTLVKAFEHYPVTRQTISADGYVDRLARYHRLFLTRIGLAHGRVWVAADHSAVADGVPAFLETHDPANVPFYESLGFDVLAELDLPDNGPKHWAMHRPRANRPPLTPTAGPPA
jgi:hypothetical protein